MIAKVIFLISFVVISVYSKHVIIHETPDGQQFTEEQLLTLLKQQQNQHMSQQQLQQVLRQQLQKRPQPPPHVQTIKQLGNPQQFSSSDIQVSEGKPKYRYDYTVSDLTTGDAKSHWETKDGDQVRGEYMLLDADGTFRKVSYVADRFGFLANVERTPAQG